jgi:predicted CoA-binding protein
MPLDVNQRIQAFLAGSPFAVAGASTDRSKYGNKVLRCYMQAKREVYPLNPAGGVIEGLTAYPSIAALPKPIHGLSIITPYPITEKLIEPAHAAGIKHLWMQPGAESAKAVKHAEDLGMSVISGGPCILVILGYHEH